MRRLPLSTFWTLQIVGWTGFYVSMAFSRLGRVPLDFMLITKTVLTLLGIAASLALRAVLKPMLARQLSLLNVVAVSVVASYVLAAIWTATFNVAVIPIAQAMLGEPAGIRSISALLSGTVYHAFSLVAWGFLYIGIKHHSAWQAERERALRAEAAAADARLRALQYQLNPHFFFNTLNAISTLIVERRNDDAAAMIARLGEFLRATLRRDVLTRVSLADELGFAQRYLDIEQIRFEDRLTVQIDMTEDAYAATVPLLILQPLVENAIRHGIAPLEGGGTLAISARTDDDRTGRWLDIVIANDAPAEEPSQNDSRGIGLTNVRERLTMLYGDRCHFTAARNGAQFRACVRIPYVAERPAAPAPSVEREPVLA
ncbi:MAG: sensor histidine kinase [Gemmatimonadaceae bacterium]